jgi:hypothetical protein
MRAHRKIAVRKHLGAIAAGRRVISRDTAEGDQQRLSEL